MQTKSIQKNIAAKLNEWLLTITDESLRKDLRPQILVSGGCVASLFLGEPVNDYDIYIQDINVLKRLVQYYILPHPGTLILDGRQKAELTQELNSKYGWLECTDEEIYTAYAISLRNLKDDQIKLFFESKNGGMRLNEGKNVDELKYDPLFFSPNAISLSNNLQIVIRFHGTPEEIHETFDFIHPTNYFTFEKGIVLNKEALESLLTKQLKYQGSMYPLTSIIRMKKFVKRNWNINAGEILKMMFQVSELDLKNPDVLEEQLIGVDVAYFSKLIEILRGVDSSATLTSSYLNAIIDRVFNGAEDVE